jgi:NDP-sugar pyrophosphorylase family protein
MKVEQIKVFTARSIMELTGIGYHVLKRVACLENEDFFFINFDKISNLAIRKLKEEIKDRQLGRKLYLEQAFWKCVFVGKNEFSNYARTFIANKVMPSITEKGLFKVKGTQLEGIDKLGEEIGETKSYFDEEDEQSFNQALQIVMEKKQLSITKTELMLNLNRAQFLTLLEKYSFVASWKRK